MTQKDEVFLGVAASNLIVFISIISVGFYFNSIAYFHSYFSVLGIPMIFFQLPLEFYLIHGVIPISTAAVIGMITCLGIFTNSDDWWTTLKGNIAFLILGILFIYMSLTDFFNIGGVFLTIVKISLFAVGAVSSIVFFYLIKNNFNTVKNTWFSNDLGKLLVVGFVLIVTVLFSINYGVFMAHRTIDGLTPDVSRVNFKLENNLTSDFDNSTLFLFFYNNGNYYAFSKNQTTGKVFELYIVPEKTIGYAKIYRITQ
jgi:hypothetical protein